MDHRGRGILRQSPVRKEKLLKEPVEHNSEGVTILTPNIKETFPTWELLPAFSPPFLACFFFLQVPQPLHAVSLPPPSASPGLNVF